MTHRRELSIEISNERKSNMNLTHMPTTIEDASMQAANMFALSILRKDIPAKDLQNNEYQEDDEQENDKAKLLKNLRVDLDQKDIDLENKQDIKLLVDLIQKQNKKKGELMCLARFFHEIPFFAKAAQKLPPQSYISLLKKIKYEYYPERRALYRKNDQGTKYHVILEGKVAVLGDKLGQSPESPSPKTKTEYEGFFPKNSVEEFRLPSPMEKKNKDGVTFFPQPNFQRQRNKKPSPSPKSPLRFVKKEPSPGASPTRRFGMVDPFEIKRSFSRSNSPQIMDETSILNPVSNSSYARASLFMKFHGNKNKEFIGEGLESQSSAEEKGETSKPLLSPILVQNEASLESGGLNENEVVGASQMSFEEFLENVFSSEKLMKDIGPGIGFGEMALVGDYKRSSTVVTMKPTRFAVLEKSSYEEILEEFKEELHREKVNFLSSLQLFQDWSNMKLSALLVMFEIKKLIRNNVIYSAEEAARHIYILKAGEIELVDMITIENKVKKPNANLNSNQKDLDPLNIQKSKPKKIQLKKIIAKIGPSSIFGEEEVFERSQRKHTAIVSSANAEIYCISKKKFFESLRATRAFKFLLDQYEVRKRWRTSFKRQINHSVLTLEEQKNKTIDKIIKNQDRLSPQYTQLKQINTRLILSPSSKKAKPNIQIDTDGLDNIVEEQPQDFILKPKENHNLHQSEESLTPTMRATEPSQEALINLKRTMTHLGSFNMTSKAFKNITLETQEDGTPNIPKVPFGAKAEIQSGSDNDASPRISSKPMVTCYDFEGEPYANRLDSKRSISPMASVQRGKATQSLEDRIKAQKLFGNDNQHKISRYLLPSPKALDPLETLRANANATPEKMRNTIYARIYGLNDVLNKSPKYMRKNVDIRRESKSFALTSTNNVSVERAIDNSLEHGRYRPVTSKFNMSLSGYHPRSSQKSFEGSPKEFVNMHVQKPLVKPKPQFHGGFLLSKTKLNGKQISNPEGVMVLKKLPALDLEYIKA